MINTTKKELEGLFKKSSNKLLTDLKHKNAVVLEELNKKFDAFGKSLDYVRQKTDENSEKIDELQEEMTTIKIDIAFIKNEITEIRNELNKKTDRYEYQELKKRVDKLESYVKRYMVEKKAAAT